MHACITSMLLGRIGNSETYAEVTANVPGNYINVEA